MNENSVRDAGRVYPNLSPIRSKSVGNLGGRQVVYPCSLDSSNAANELFGNLKQSFDDICGVSPREGKSQRKKLAPISPNTLKTQHSDIGGKLANKVKAIKEQVRQLKKVRAKSISTDSTTSTRGSFSPDAKNEDPLNSASSSRKTTQAERTPDKPVGIREEIQNYLKSSARMQPKAKIRFFYSLMNKHSKGYETVGQDKSIAKSVFQIGRGGQKQVFLGCDLKTGELLAVSSKKERANNPITQKEKRDKTQKKETARKDNQGGALGLSLDFLGDIEESGVKESYDGYKLFEKVEGLSEHHILLRRELHDPDRGEILTLSSYCSGGTMDSLLTTNPNIKQLTTAVEQMMQAIAKLQDMRISHQDLKADNFLIDHNGNLLLTDLNGAVTFEECSRKIDEGDVTGITQEYSPYEQLDYADIPKDVDPSRGNTYQMGIIFYQIAAHMELIRSKAELPSKYVKLNPEIVKNRMPLTPMERLQHYNQKTILNEGPLKELASWMMQKYPQDRPSIEEIHAVLPNVLQIEVEQVEPWETKESGATKREEVAHSSSKSGFTTSSSQSSPIAEKKLPRQFESRNPFADFSDDSEETASLSLSSQASFSPMATELEDSYQREKNPFSMEDFVARHGLIKKRS